MVEQVYQLETGDKKVVEKVIKVKMQSPALDLLKQLDLDDLTPRQALEHLYQLKALSKSSDTIEN